jgi:RNA polymerase sigma factor (sigma-70 family)
MDPITLNLKRDWRWIKWALCRNIAYRYKLNDDDLFSTVLEKVWRYRDRFKDGSNFRGWVTVIAYNAAKDTLRFNQCRPDPLSVELEVMALAVTEMEARVSDTFLPALYRAELMRHIELAYGHQAACFVAASRAGYTTGEIGKRYNMSRWSVWNTLRKIADALKSYHERT